MKRAAATVAVVVAFVLGAAACGGSTRPAGRGILLVRNLGDGEKAQVVLWRPGSAPKPLGPAGYGISGPAWSPDGGSIAFSEQVGPPGGTAIDPTEIHLMRPDGTKVTQLSHDSRNAYFNSGRPPSWSPDGLYLVYARSLGASPWQDFRILDVRSGHVRTLPNNAWWSDPVWGAAGIAYRGYPGIMLLNPASGRSRLVNGGSFDPELVWSSSGVIAAVELKGIVLLAPSGRVLGNLPFPPAERAVCAIDWSPDGRQIVVLTAKEKGGLLFGTTGLWVGTMRTKRWRRLTLPMASPRQYACSLSWR